jgi:hypothetical protein
MSRLRESTLHKPFRDGLAEIAATDDRDLLVHVRLI